MQAYFSGKKKFFLKEKLSQDTSILFFCEKYVKT